LGAATSGLDRTDTQVLQNIDRASLPLFSASI